MPQHKSPNQNWKLSYFGASQFVFSVTTQDLPFPLSYPMQVVFLSVAGSSANCPDCTGVLAFHWLTPFVFYLQVTVMHSVQAGYMEKAQKYTDKALIQIEKLKSKSLCSLTSMFSFSTSKKKCDLFVFLCLLNLQYYNAITRYFQYISQFCFMYCRCSTVIYLLLAYQVLLLPVVPNVDHMMSYVLQWPMFIHLWWSI